MVNIKGIRKNVLRRSGGLLIALVLIIGTLGGGIDTSFAGNPEDGYLIIFPVTTESNKIVTKSPYGSAVMIYIIEDDGKESLLGGRSVLENDLFILSITPQAEGTKLKVMSGNGRNDFEKTIIVTKYTPLSGSSAKSSGKTVKITAKSSYEPPEPRVSEVPMEFAEVVTIEDEIVPLGAIKYTKAYIQGYPDGTFRPNQPVTRGEVAALFARILSLDLEKQITSEPRYTDLSSDQWTYEYVQALDSVKILSGYDDFTFKPSKSISHAEVATMISRYWSMIGARVSAADAGVSDISGTWAEKHINKMYNAGVITVEEVPNFNPNEPTTRAELIAWINKLTGRGTNSNNPPVFTDVKLNEDAASEIGSASYDWK